MKKIIVPIVCVLCSFLPASGLLAHEDEKFSPSFVDPLELHHAHLETHLILKNDFRVDVREETEEESGETRTEYKDVFENSAEIALASENSRLGMEMNIPFSNEGRDEAGKAVYGLGDMEIQPIQYAWVNETETVFTSSIGFILPTGDRSQGSGEGRAFVEPHFLFDHAFQDWYLGANLIPGLELGGEHEKTLGWGAAIAYTFQRPRLAVSLELSGESSLSGESEGLDVVRLTPGLHWEFGERQLRVGMRLPLSSDREEARAWLFSVTL